MPSLNAVFRITLPILLWESLQTQTNIGGITFLVIIGILAL